jgi:Sec-independent protein translocase protein TatA
VLRNRALELVILLLLATSLSGLKRLPGAARSLARSLRPPWREADPGKAAARGGPPENRTDPSA